MHCVCLSRDQLIAMVKSWRRVELQPKTQTNQVQRTTGNTYIQAHTHSEHTHILRTHCSGVFVPPQVGSSSRQRRTILLHDISLADSSGRTRLEEGAAPIGGHLARVAEGGLS